MHSEVALVMQPPIKKIRRALQISLGINDTSASRTGRREPSPTMSILPITDTAVHVYAQLVDDSGNNSSCRELSHPDIDFQVNAAGLATFDPKQRQRIGEAKRVRAALYEAITTNPVGGLRFAMELLGKIRACIGTVVSYLLATFATHGR